MRIIGSGPEASEESRCGSLHLRERDSRRYPLGLVIVRFQGLEALVGDKRGEGNEVVDEVVRVKRVSKSPSVS